MAGVVKVDVDYKAGQAVITFDAAKQAGKSFQVCHEVRLSGERNEGSLNMRVTEKLTPVAAAMSALATLACCLPLGIAGAVGALGLSVALERLRPWLIGLAMILLGVSAFQMYRGQRSCQKRSRLSLILFRLSAAVVLAVVIFPQKLAELMAALQ